MEAHKNSGLHSLTSFLFIFSLSLGSFQAQGAGLRGFQKKLDVVVEELPKKIQKRGLTPESIRKKFTEELKKNGVQVNPDADALLAVTIKLLPIPRGVSSFYILELRETAKLMSRNPVQQQVVTTWTKSGLLVSSKNDVIRHLREKLSLVLSEFLQEMR